jgi:hypothetical protein
VDDIHIREQHKGDDFMKKAIYYSILFIAVLVTFIVTMVLCCSPIALIAANQICTHQYEQIIGGEPIRSGYLDYRVYEYISTIVSPGMTREEVDQALTDSFVHVEINMITPDRDQVTIKICPLPWNPPRFTFFYSEEGTLEDFHGSNSE